MYVKGELIKGALDFKILTDSCPIIHNGIKCSYVQPSKTPLSGPQYKHFNYVMRSITLHEKLCINTDFF
jgi:hypothetical protein